MDEGGILNEEAKRGVAKAPVDAVDPGDYTH
jgi:hypothetical protein